MFFSRTEFDAMTRAREPARLRQWLHGVTGCLAVLGQSVLCEQCQELRTHVRESTEWDEEISLQARSIADALGRMTHSCSNSAVRGASCTPPADSTE